MEMNTNRVVCVSTAMLVMLLGVSVEGAKKKKVKKKETPKACKIKFKDDCKKCVECALGNECRLEFETCQEESVCLKFMECAVSCPLDSTDCFQGCIKQYPKGKVYADIVHLCLNCQGCYEVCPNSKRICGER